MATNPAANAIRRARRRAQNEMARRLREFEAELLLLYRQAGLQIDAGIRRAETVEGLIDPARARELRQQIDDSIDAVRQQSEGLILQSINGSAALGVQPFEGRQLERAVQEITDEIVRGFREFAAADGLQLSERVWRTTTQARRELQAAVETAIAEGQSASRAAQEFVARGQGVPDDILDKRRRARAVAIAVKSRNAMDGGKHYRATLQVMRTETIRAHGLAHRAAAAADPDVIGVRYMLSPRHPAPDICDVHANANIYGLGKGVYPPDRSPWPAHPNTFSFEQIKYRDEVEPEERENKFSRVDWLNDQPDSVVEGALGDSPAKLRAFRAGHVGERSITTPWRVLRQRLERQGVNVSRFEAG